MSLPRNVTSLNMVAAGAPSLNTVADDGLRLARRAYVPVLVTAASRDQRGVCARLIHAGAEGDRPFVAFPTGSVGAAKESADSSRTKDPDDVLLRRLFERARGGTLFIDDVATLTPAAQTQLLSLLEDRLPRTALSAEQCGVRVIAGASHHLDADCATGAFRDSLYYRLNVIHINLIARPAENSAQLL